jgi:putative PEP-CTERM system TPR-repeat lipoprotein
VVANKLHATNDIDPAVLDLLGQSQMATNDQAGALVTYRKLVSSRPKLAPAQLRIASIQMAMHNEGDAIASLNKALAIQPDYLEAQVGLASVYARKGDFDAGLKIARQIQKQRDALPVGFVLEGDLLMAQKKPAPALKAYEQAASKGKSGQLVIKQHEALRAAGREKDADARLVQWLADTPEDVPTRLYFATSLAARNQTKAAIAQYEVALKAAPQNPAILNNLAVAYQLDKDTRALATAEQALTLAPTNPVVMDTLGWILVEKGTDPRGLDLLQKAAAKVPGINDIHLHLGAALLKAGDKVAGRKELQALADAPGYAHADEAKRLLKEL